MSSGNTSRFHVTSEDLRTYPWQELLSSHPHKDCQTYYKVFGKAASNHQAAGDELGVRVYGFLNVIASFWPSFGSDISPYRPMRQDPDGRRSLVPDDLADEDLDALRGIVDDITDPEYRARVADVLWICRRDFKAAQLAVSSFIEAANKLKDGRLWPPYVERLDRAALISSKRGFEIQREAIVHEVETAIREFENDHESGLLCARLMAILLLLGAGDPSNYSALSTRLAREFSRLGEWLFSENYWRVAENWHRLMKDESALQESMIEAAECNISRAESELKEVPPRKSSAAHWMGRGLEALRRARAEPARIKQVHLKFLALQKEALSELTPMGMESGSIPDFEQNRETVQEASVRHVSGFSFEEALIRFANIGDPTNVEQLAENERRNSEGMPWDKLMGTIRIDRDGKVVDEIPSFGFGEDDSDQAAFRKKMVQSASMLRWPLVVEWQIEPARRAIAREHPIRARDLSFLVANNPFIPPGHEGIYLRGFQAGFFGDWLLAMHLIIPQLEASLRYVLQQHGEVTSTLESNGQQKEADINQLLWREASVEIFGEDVMFDLRGVLIERFGCNMRNESAHGLMAESTFYRPESVYLWWLALRLCWHGFNARLPNSEEDIEPTG
jgi:hypothetical protein